MPKTNVTPITPVSANVANDYLLTLRENGFNCVPSGRGKTPILQLNPETKKQEWRCWRDEIPQKTLARWSGAKLNGLCILTDGLVVIDADSPALVERLYALEDEHDCHPVLVGFTPKGEHHYWLRGDVECRAVGADGKLDIRTDGGQVFVFDASNPANRELENWDLERDELSVVDETFLDAVYAFNGLARVREVHDRSTRVYDYSLPEIEHLLTFLSPDCNYDDWMHIIAGVHRGTGGSEAGLTLVDDWSSRGESYPGSGAVETKWRSFDEQVEGGITLGSVVRLAREQGYEPTDGSLTDDDREALAAVLGVSGGEVVTRKHEPTSDAAVIEEDSEEDDPRTPHQANVVAAIRSALELSMTDDIWDMCINWQVLYRAVRDVYVINSKFTYMGRCGLSRTFQKSELLEELAPLYGQILNSDALRAGVQDRLPDDATDRQVAAVVKSWHGLIRNAIAAGIAKASLVSGVRYSRDLFATASSTVVEGKELEIIEAGHGLREVPAFVGYVKTKPEQYQACIDAYRAHFPQIEDFLDFIVAARFVNNRRRCYLWLHAGSSFGKTFLLSEALSTLDIVAGVDVDVLANAIEGRPSQLQAGALDGKWVVWVDEWSKAKAEIKQLENRMTWNPKFGAQTSAELYAKVFTSAEVVESLVGDSGVESQFANRFIYLRGGNDAFGSIALRQELGDWFIDAITCYVHDYIMDAVEDYVEMGRVDAANTAAKLIDTLHSRYSLTAAFGSINDEIESRSGDFKAMIESVAKDVWEAKKHGRRASYYESRENGGAAAKFPLSAGVYEAFEERLVCDEATGRVVLTRAVNAVKIWLSHDFASAHGEQFKLAHKARDIVDGLDGEGIRVYKVGNGTKKGLLVGDFIEGQ